MGRGRPSFEDLAERTAAPRGLTDPILPPRGPSCEPDLVLVSLEALLSGRVTETPARDGGDGIELVGAPELVVEIVSPSSVGKDTGDLFRGYYEGGVVEYWLVDCRDDEAEGVAFTIHTRGADGFEPVPADADGFAASAVLKKAYRLARARGRTGRWAYTLAER